MDGPQSRYEDPLLPDDLLYARSTCSALVITCSDFRFKAVERAFAEAAGLAGDYDLIARPGAIRSLVAPRNDAARQSMEEEIALLWKLHRFTRVLMVNHLSCRAYDDLAATADERAIHEAHLRAATAAIARRNPALIPEPYLIALTGDVLQVTSVEA
jgi:hypothetical protein